MVRKYKRKTQRCSYSQEQMNTALQKILEGQNVNSVARLHQVPRTTLQKLFHNLKCSETPGADIVQVVSKLKTGRAECVFTKDQEQIFCEKINKLNDQMLGITHKDLRNIAFELAERMKIDHPFNKVKRKAGKDWARSFMDRNSMSIRKSERTSAARAKSFNRKNVEPFYKLAKEIIDKHKLTANDIYNCDETGITVVPKSGSRVIAKKGLRRVAGLSSAERGENITAEVCFSAAGQFMPPLLIFPRVNRNQLLLQGAPHGAYGEFHKSGWIQTDIFYRWLKKFIEFSNASKNNRKLLILDGHSTHVKSLDVIDLADDNGVTIICLPPHTTHHLQPADVGIMKPISTYYNDEVQAWLRENRGQVVTLAQVFYLFGRAYDRAATIDNAKGAFRKTGIWPLNPHIFDQFFENQEKAKESQSCPQTEGVATTSDTTSAMVQALDEIDLINYKKKSPKEGNKTETINPAAPYPIITIGEISGVLCNYIQEKIGSQPQPSNLGSISADQKIIINYSKNKIGEIIDTTNSVQQLDIANKVSTPCLKTNKRKKSTPPAQKKSRQGKTAIITDPEYRAELVAEKNEQEAKKAEQEVKKAEREAKKAEQEVKKAEQEAKKAEREAKKAEREENKLTNAGKNNKKILNLPVMKSMQVIKKPIGNPKDIKQIVKNFELAGVPLNSGQNEVQLAYNNRLVPTDSTIKNQLNNVKAIIQNNRAMDVNSFNSTNNFHATTVIQNNTPKFNNIEQKKVVNVMESTSFNGKDIMNYKMSALNSSFPTIHQNICNPLNNPSQHGTKFLAISSPYPIQKCSSSPMIIKPFKGEGHSVTKMM